MPRLRFSLRSLLLAALTLGSLGLLWRNHEPWSPSTVIKFTNVRPGTYLKFCCFDGDNAERFFAWFVSSDKIQHQYYDAHSGSQLSDDTYEFPAGTAPDGLETSTFFTRVCNKRFAFYGTRNRVMLKDRQTGRSEMFHNDSKVEIDVPQETAFPGIVLLLKGSNDYSLLRIPERQEILRISARYACLIHKGKTLAALRDDSRMQFFSADTGKLEREWLVLESASHFGTLRNDENFLIYRFAASNLLYNASGRQLHDFRTSEFMSVFSDDKFALIGDAIWQLEPDIQKTGTIPSAVGLKLFYPQYILQRTDGRLESFEIPSGKRMWSLEHNFKSIPDTLFDRSTTILVQPSDTFEAPYPGKLIDVKTGATLFEFSFTRWPKAFPEDRVQIHDATFFTTQKTATFQGPTEAILWRQRRPTEWYGLAWLPELWLTAALAVAFIWSLFKDRRMA